MECEAIVRSLNKDDVGRVMRIWLEANIDAHDFIPESYWREQFGSVKEMIPAAEVYVYEKSGEIMGFVGLSGNYIAGIFVAPGSQSRGIGKRLLDYVKSFKTGLHLDVYQKNNRAVEFYRRENFAIRSENTDESTGEKEFSMISE